MSVASTKSFRVSPLRGSFYYKLFLRFSINYRILERERWGHYPEVLTLFYISYPPLFWGPGPTLSLTA